MLYAKKWRRLCSGVLRQVPQSRHDGFSAGALLEEDCILASDQSQIALGTNLTGFGSPQIEMAAS
jgi:hypothetical protein